MVQAKNLEALRVEIDEIDHAIVALLDRRAGCSRAVGRIKADSCEGTFRPFREREIMDRLMAVSAGTLPAEDLRTIYREIFSSSRRLQQPQQVAYLGPEGTFSYFAGVEFLGHAVSFLPRADIPAVFHAVSSGETGLGVIPLENSLRGTVGQSLDLFFTHTVCIHSEMFFRISHCLLGKAKNLSDIRTVYSHPQPLGQCGGWLRTHIPEAKIIPTESTAAAAARIQDDSHAVAIGHQALGTLFDLRILARGIEDMPDNWTRFVIIGKDPAPLQGRSGGRNGGPNGGRNGGRDKTSMLFTLPDQPGALVTVLSVLAQQGINMKKLESRPMHGQKWEYVFFVDVESDLTDVQHTRLLDDLRRQCHSMRVLGSYPAGPCLEFSSGEQLTKASS